MNFKDIKIESKKVSQVIHDWCDKGGHEGLEKDLIMAKLRDIYDAVRFAESASSGRIDSSGAATTEQTCVSVGNDSVYDKHNIKTLEDNQFENNQFEANTTAVNINDFDQTKLHKDIATDKVETIYETTRAETTLAHAQIGNTEQKELNTTEATEHKEADTTEATEHKELNTTEATEHKEIEHKEIETTSNGVDGETAQLKDITNKEDITEKKEVKTALFDVNDFELRKHKQRAIMSLYSDDKRIATPPAVEKKPSVSSRTTLSSYYEDNESTEEERDDDDFQQSRDSYFKTDESTYLETETKEFSESQETIFEKPTNFAGNGGEFAESSHAILGDIISDNRHTLADTMANSNIINSNRIDNIKDAIGVNDRFLLVRDLFGYSNEEYNRTMEIINNFNNLDDCLIYIAENHNWNPNSDGARLIMELIERKFTS